MALYFEATLTNAAIYLDIEPSDTTKVLRITYISPIEDFNAATDTADYPQSYFRALGAQLACDMAPAFGATITPELKLLRDESTLIAKNTNPQTSNDFFEPSR